MREVPKKALPSEGFGCFGAKMSDQRQAVDGSVLGELSSGSLKNAGEQIDRGDRLVRHNSRWNGGWPTYQKGHPDATFVAVSFSASQRRVFGRISISVQAPIVAGEDDHGILVDSMLFQFREHISHAIVNGFDHGRILTIRFRHSLLEFVLIRHFLDGLDGCVNRVMGNLNEERLIFPFSDESNRFIRLAVSQVFSLLSSRQFVDTRANGGVLVLGVVVGIEEGRGLPIVATPEIFMVTLLFGIPWLCLLYTSPSPRD